MSANSKAEDVDGSHSPIRDEDRAKQRFWSCSTQSLRQQWDSEGFVQTPLHRAEATSSTPAHQSRPEEHS